MSHWSASGWHSALRVFDDLAECSPGRLPDSYVSAAGNDPERRAKVDALLAASAEAPTFLSRDALQLGASLLAAEEQTGNTGGREVGPYSLCERIGNGGMGVVYRAVRNRGDFAHEVAIKLLPGRFHAIDTTARFAREQRVLAALNHPGIARLYDGGTTDDGQPYIVMEYVRGERIDTYCDSRRLSIRQRLELVRQIARALQHAHQNLVVHRDLKPSNVFVDESGQVRLLDFGISKLLDDTNGRGATLDAGMQPMTPRYAAPEQLTGGPISVATDVYQLGVLLFELLCGGRPYGDSSEDIRALARSICERPVLTMSAAFGHLPASSAERAAAGRGTQRKNLQRALRGDLDAIAAQALNKRPADRYLSMEALCRDIDASLSQHPVRARRRGGLYRWSCFARRHRAAVAGAAGMAAMIVVYLATLTVQHDRIARALLQAETDARKATEVSEFLVDLFNSSDPDTVRGKTPTLRQILDAGEMRIAAAMTSAPEIRSHMLQVLAKINYNLGDYPKSVALLHEALLVQRGSGGATALEIARTGTQLGIALAAIDDFSAAQSSLEESIASLRFSGDRGADLAEALNALGLLLRRTGSPEKAEGAFNEAIGILRAIDDGANGELPVALNNLATLHASRGDYLAAETLMREVVTRQERALGPNHSYYSVSLNNLGRIQLLLGRYEQARETLTQVLELQRVNLGPAHPYVAHTLHALGVLAYKRERTSEAVPLLQQALRLQQAADQRAAAAGTMRTLGEVRQAQGDLAEADRLYSRTLAIDRALYGDDSPRVGRDLALLASLAIAQEDLELAERRLDAAVVLLAPRDGELATASMTLARLRVAQDRPADAREAARRALSMRRGMLPENHPDLVAAQALFDALAAAEARQSST